MTIQTVVGLGISEPSTVEPTLQGLNSLDVEPDDLVSKNPSVEVPLKTPR